MEEKISLNNNYDTLNQLTDEEYLTYATKLMNNLLRNLENANQMIYYDLLNKTLCNYMDHILKNNYNNIIKDLYLKGLIYIIDRILTNIDKTKSDDFKNPYYLLCYLSSFNFSLNYSYQERKYNINILMVFGIEMDHILKDGLLDRYVKIHQLLAKRKNLNNDFKKLCNLNSTIIESCLFYVTDNLIEDKYKSIIIRRCYEVLTYLEHIIKKLNISNFTEIDLSGSDPHNFKQVLFFTNGVNKFVYKPRSLDPEIAFDNIVKEINKHINIINFLTEHNFTILNNNKDTIEKYENKITSMNTKEAKDYYYKIGLLIFTMLLCGLTDIHQDNIIPTKTENERSPFSPFIVDCECIKHPIFFARTENTINLISTTCIFLALTYNETINKKYANHVFQIDGNLSTTEVLKYSTYISNGFIAAKDIFSNLKDGYTKIYNLIKDIKKVRYVPVATNIFCYHFRLFHDLKSDVVKKSYLKETIITEIKLKIEIFATSLLENKTIENALINLLYQNFIDGNIPRFEIDYITNTVIIEDVTIAKLKPDYILDEKKYEQYYKNLLTLEDESIKEYIKKTIEKYMRNRI